VKFFISIIFILSNLFALSESVKDNLRLVYQEASKYKAYDGHTFNDTMVCITLTETSGGKNLIGDSFYKTGKEKHFFLKSLGINQVKLETAIIVLRKYNLGYEHLLHKNPFAFKEYIPLLDKLSYFQNIKRRYIKKRKTQRTKRVLKWVDREINYLLSKIKKYKDYYKKDEKIVSLLLSDKRFNTMIAVHYLIMNYEYAKRKRMWNPYFKAISKYNDGWKNIRYYKRVQRNMKFWRKIKKSILKGN